MCLIKYKFSLPNSLSNNRLKVFFGRKLTQESAKVTGENSISMSGIPKRRKKESHYFVNGFLKYSFASLNKKETNQLFESFSGKLKSKRMFFDKLIRDIF